MYVKVAPNGTQTHSISPPGSTLSRSTMALDVDPESGSQESLQEAGPEEVLVISLGNTPRSLPGMMSENDVRSMLRILDFIVNTSSRAVSLAPPPGLLL